MLGRLDGEVVFDAYRGAANAFATLALLGERNKVPTFHQSCPLDLFLDPVREVLLDLKERVQIAGVDRTGNRPMNLDSPFWENRVRS